jgi:hypothetical protein
MLRILVAGALMALLLAGAARAQQAAYMWTGNGTGSGKCPGYKMTIDVTVDGKAVTGLFQQAGRAQRHFEAMLDANGVFKTKAQVGSGGSMEVTGAIKGGDGEVMLDGYCRFGGKIVKK